MESATAPRRKAAIFAALTVKASVRRQTSRLTSLKKSSAIAAIRPASANRVACGETLLKILSESHRRVAEEDREPAYVRIGRLRFRGFGGVAETRGLSCKEQLVKL